MGIISVYSQEKDYRPKCKLTLHSDMLGDIRNSNLAEYYAGNQVQGINDSAATKIVIPEFYLTELPQFSFSTKLDTNNGAKLAEKLKGFGEGQIMGISVGEIVQNSNDNAGFVPAMVLGPSSFKVAKDAARLAITLKTRIPYKPVANANGSNDTQAYNILLSTLMRLSLPTDASKIDTQYLKSAVTNFFNGMDDTVGNIGANLGFDFNAFGDAVKEVAGLYADTGRMMMASNKDEMMAAKADMESRRATIGDCETKIAAPLENLVNNVIKNYIYREYITLKITRDGKKILSNYSDLAKYKFVLTGWNVTQSNQLYGDTLFPVYMDFEMNLESMGVVIGPEPG